MKSIQEFENTIMCGDCREIMSQWDDGCIDMVITSPPYWSLRDYKLKPLIWDGAENCEHRWGKEYLGDARKSNEGKHWWQDGNYKGIAPHFKISQGNFCSLCGAWKGQLGLEPTFDLYIKHLCDIFDEVKRVLKKEGNIWVNMGDTYWGGGQGGADYGGKETTPEYAYGKIARGNNYQSKSLCCIPDRFKIEMINRGWICRNTIIWHKSNPMPSSAKDRFTVDFEYLFFFTKNNKSLFWTNEKTLELVTKQPLGIKGIEGIDWEWRETGNSYSDSNTKISSEESEKFGSPRARVYRKKKRKKVSFWKGHDYYFEQQFEEHLTDLPIVKKKTCGHGAVRPENEPDPWGSLGYGAQGRNMRCVWTIPTMPCSEAHFAVFPEKLLMTPIKSGCPEFVCKKCGKARVKIIENKTLERYELSREDKRYRPKRYTGKYKQGMRYAEQNFKGYTDCGCHAGFEDGIVLDPFAGRGTTGIVARKLGRKYILIDLSPKYCEMARKELKNIIVKKRTDNSKNWW